MADCNLSCVYSRTWRGRFERSPFAFALDMDRQEEEKRGMTIACNMKESSADMGHYNIIDCGVSCSVILI